MVCVPTYRIQPRGASPGAFSYAACKTGLLSAHRVGSCWTVPDRVRRAEITPDSGRCDKALDDRGERITRCPDGRTRGCHPGVRGDGVSAHGGRPDEARYGTRFLARFRRPVVAHSSRGRGSTTTGYRSFDTSRSVRSRVSSAVIRRSGRGTNAITVASNSSAAARTASVTLVS